jgi:hypothetical protein
MGDRRREFAHGRQPRHLRQLRLGRLRGLVGADAFALRINQVRDIPVDADHAHGFAGRVPDDLPQAANDADLAIGPPHLEVGREFAIAAKCRLDIRLGSRDVFRNDALRPGVESATEFFLANAVQPVHRVVPNQLILFDVPIPDAERRRVDRELQSLFAGTQPGFAFLQLALATLPGRDFSD